MYPKPIYVVDGARTPFLKSEKPPRSVRGQRSRHAGGPHAARAPEVRADELDEVISCCAAPSVDEVNIGRVAATAHGLRQQVPGWTVMRNCVLRHAGRRLRHRQHPRGTLGARSCRRRRRAVTRAAVCTGTRWSSGFRTWRLPRSTGQKLATFARLPVNRCLPGDRSS